MHCYVYCSIIYNSQIMEAAQVFINKRVDKEDAIHIHTYIHTHTHTGILLSQKKKNEILPFAMKWMELEGIMLSEISQRKRNTV